MQLRLKFMLVCAIKMFKTSIVPDVTLWNGIVADVPEENVQVQLDLECMLLHPRKKYFNIH
jgi:hypothetical protein